MPANCTSTGKAMLAYCTDGELRRLYPDEELGGVPPNSIRTRSALEKELEQVRRRGYATSNEESENGVCSVAVAYPPRQAPVRRLALNVAVPVHRMNSELAGRLAAALKAAVAESAGLLH